MATLTPFWALYHRLMDWTDAEGMSDADKQDAAAWMRDMHNALSNAVDSDKTDAHARSVCRLAIDAINTGRTHIYPLKGAE